MDKPLDKINKLKKLSTYESFWIDYSNILTQIAKDDIDVIEFRSAVNVLIEKIITEVEGNDHFFTRGEMGSGVGPRSHVQHGREPAGLVHLAAARLGRADSGGRLHEVRRGDRDTGAR